MGIAFFRSETPLPHPAGRVRDCSGDAAFRSCRSRHPGDGVRRVQRRLRSRRPPRLGSIQELFAAGARITTVRNGQTETLTPDEYIAKYKPHFNEHALFRHPSSMRIERHGDGAHVVANDESRNASNDEKPFAQGGHVVRFRALGRCVEDRYHRDASDRDLPPHGDPRRAAASSTT